MQAIAQKGEVNMVEAFIFDLDGVITDTANFHYLAWKELGKKIGIENR